MKAYERILLPIDFSATSEAAAKRAADMTRRYGAELWLIHVIEHHLPDLPSERIVMEDVDPDDYLTQPARELLADFARRMEISHCPQHVFYGGGTTHEIIQFAQAMSADLIIVGSHGQHGISHLLGSTAGSLLHHADCDVLVVRAREQ